LLLPASVAERLTARFQYIPDYQVLCLGGYPVTIFPIDRFVYTVILIKWNIVFLLPKLKKLDNVMLTKI